MRKKYLSFLSGLLLVSTVQAAPFVHVEFYPADNTSGARVSCIKGGVNATKCLCTGIGSDVRTCYFKFNHTIPTGLNAYIWTAPWSQKTVKLTAYTPVGKEGPSYKYKISTRCECTSTVGFNICTHLKWKCQIHLKGLDGTNHKKYVLIQHVHKGKPNIHVQLSVDKDGNVTNFSAKTALAPWPV